MRTHVYLSYFACLFFALMSFLPMQLLAQDEEPIAIVAPADPGPIVCGQQKSTNIFIPEVAYSGATEAEAYAKLLDDLLLDLAIAGWECTEPPDCPGTTTCEFHIVWPSGKPRGKKDPESGKWVFGPKTKNANIKCRCEGDFTDPDEPGEHDDHGSHFPIDQVEEMVYGSFQLFPNPASDRLQVQLRLNEISENMHLQIMDAAGKQLSAKKLSSDIARYTIDISDLLPGIYFMSLYEGDLRIESAKFVVEHQ